MQILSILLLIAGLVLAIPLLWFCIQIVCACLPARSTATYFPADILSTEPPRVSILIPAHNESVHLIPTLKSIHSQHLPGLRILVVADNCTDDTATIARTHGAEVIERFNPRLRGKGYALDFGVRHLAGQAPDVLIILDADCLLEPQALELLTFQALSTRRPVQALYLMKNLGAASIKDRIAEFAWRVKNHLRPRGLHRVGLPCQLTGSGMAFPWTALEGVPLASGEIVEDMKLGVMLAERGYAPVFCEQAVVHSIFPLAEDAVKTQRTRWEHGHMSMIAREGFPKMGKALRLANRPLFFLALDLCIPPLALLVILGFLWGTMAIGYAFWSGDWRFFAAACTGFALLAGSVLLAWWKVGRVLISARELLMAPVYIVSKLSVYAGFVIRRQVEWVRSKRDNEIK